MRRIKPCETQEDITIAAALIAELGAWDSEETNKLGFAAEDVLDFYYTAESDPLDPFLPPHGCFLLGFIDTAAAGCVAYRRMGPGTCEMKRLYVRPMFRGTGLGHALAVALLSSARQAGYVTMRLETVQFMVGAIRLYEALGFGRCVPYYSIPADFLPITIFMDKDLTAG